MKRTRVSFLAMLLILTLAACSGSVGISTGSSTGILPDSQSETAVTPEPTAVATRASSDVTSDPIAVEYDSDDLATDAGTGVVSAITFDGSSINVAGDGAVVEGSTVTLIAAGTYSFSGTLDDGRIIVDAQDEGVVGLILNGVTIASSTSAPIHVVQADKAVITLADGTENTVSDGDSYVYPDAETDEPDAAIFSADDLTINGTGTLVVNAAYNNGIASKDDLKIVSGTVTVAAANDGIKGKDSLAIRDGIITVNAGGDGLQSTNDTDAETGYIAIEGGTLNITADLDAIQAETRLLVSGGDITVVSGGGSANASWGAWGQGGATAKATDTASAKGLKAKVEITIEDGTLTIDSSDDAIHSNDSLTINGGTITLASGDDGLHADATLTINGGALNVAKAYEGIESSTITFNGGTIYVVASDDAVNAAGGADGSAMGGRSGQNAFAETGDNHLYINGGTIVVDSGGDGLDANGPISMTGGLVLVNGPTDNGNGPLDYLGSFEMTGGMLVAVGSAGMAQAPSGSSTQYVVAVTYDTPQAGSTLVHIASADGQGVLTFAPTKTYQSVVLCSPDLRNGTTYTVYSGGSSTGTVADGLYTGGTYSGGTEVTSFTISSIVTTAASFAGGFGAPGAPMGAPGDRRHP